MRFQLLKLPLCADIAPTCVSGRIPVVRPRRIQYYLRAACQCRLWSSTSFNADVILALIAVSSDKISCQPIGVIGPAVARENILSQFGECHIWSRLQTTSINVRLYLIFFAALYPSGLEYITSGNIYLFGGLNQIPLTDLRAVFQVLACSNRGFIRECGEYNRRGEAAWEVTARSDCYTASTRTATS